MRRKGWAILSGVFAALGVLCPIIKYLNHVINGDYEVFLPGYITVTVILVLAKQLFFCKFISGPSLVTVA